jgi:hypothetical protein
LGRRGYPGVLFVRVANTELTDLRVTKSEGQRNAFAENRRDRRLLFLRGTPEESKSEEKSGCSFSSPLTGAGRTYGFESDKE